ncbi:hypothetical protein AALP_AA5G248100 [Arabis alpina]|uniref:Bet v I/Major latex protein domain-containing protein n=1 Tax=Arabis alpina TaxID=50452 RepID=A0A087GZ63_ARAAL|nr:hypothetical protein AALP_AA5G248100 [Arabis alpina]
MAGASSLVGKLEIEVEIITSAEKFHHMFAGRLHHISKATPGNIQSCELQEGDWGKVGSVIFWNYVHAGEAKVFRRGGAPLVLPSEPALPTHGGPGSIVHWHLEYEKISDAVAHPENLLQFCVDMSKDIDEHLLTEE